MWMSERRSSTPAFFPIFSPIPEIVYVRARAIIEPNLEDERSNSQFGYGRLKRRDDGYGGLGDD